VPTFILSGAPKFNYSGTELRTHEVGRPYGWLVATVDRSFMLASILRIALRAVDVGVGLPTDQAEAFGDV
jgi:hypothetical protein